jgi:hypothetical protein
LRGLFDALGGPGPVGQLYRERIWLVFVKRHGAGALIHSGHGSMLLVGFAGKADK